MYLWTHEHQNERAQRLYRIRSFAPTGRTMHDDEGQTSLIFASLWRSFRTGLIMFDVPSTCADEDDARQR